MAAINKRINTVYDTKYSAQTSIACLSSSGVNALRECDSAQGCKVTGNKNSIANPNFEVSGLIKPFQVEVFHKPLKSNIALIKSPTRRVIMQNNHVFMLIYAVFKLECLKIKHKTKTILPY